MIMIMKGFYLMPHPPIMIPEIGKGEESKINKTILSCEKVAKDIAQKDVDTIILISPHGIVFRDAVAVVTENYIQGDLSKFNAADVSMKLEIDKTLTEAIIKLAKEKNILTASLNNQTAKSYGTNLELDHGAMIPLYYILKEKQYKIVHIAYGMLSPLELYDFGMVIKEAVHSLGASTAFIASGDLSHRLKLSGPYSYSTYGKEFDSKLIKILEDGRIEELFSLNNKLISEAGECGLRSIYIMAGAMDGLNVKGEVLSYEGTFGVGYGVVKFSSEQGESIYEALINIKAKEHRRKMEQGNEYTKLARKSIDYFLENGKYLEVPMDLSRELIEEKRGVFVSLKKEGDLRGCIGTISSTTNNIAEEIIKNAVSAATEDPRFSEVAAQELLDIDISVDVLFEAESASREELDPKKYGVIVTKGTKRGLLLPNLEGVDTVEEQLKIACQKAGISVGSDYSIERFKVERHKEVEDNE